MANNRLYLVNTSTHQHVCIAKGFAHGWQLGNVDLLDQFLQNSSDFENHAILIGTENDNDFCELLSATQNVNPGGWKYHEPSLQPKTIFSRIISWLKSLIKK